MKTCYSEYGGWGYAHVHDNIIPWVKSLRAREDQVESIMAANPRPIHAAS
jgi:predicted metal-dependent phosphotriesterase family hydrolase